MTMPGKRSTTGFSPGQSRVVPAHNAATSRILLRSNAMPVQSQPDPPPGSGDLDDEGFVAGPAGRPLVPIQTPDGPRQPLEVPVRNPMTPQTQAPLVDALADLVEAAVATDTLPVTASHEPDMLFELPFVPGVAISGPVLTSSLPNVDFMPDVPDNPRNARASDDPIYQVCSRCGMPYGTFIDDPFTGKLVHRYTTSCSDNMNSPNPFPEVTTRVEVLHLPS